MSPLRPVDYKVILQSAKRIAFKKYKEDVLLGLRDNYIDVQKPSFYKKMKKCKSFSSIYNMFQGTIFYEGQKEELLSNMLNSFGVNINI